MKTVNDKLRDESIRHQLDLFSYSNSQVRRIISTLNKVDADIFAQLSIALDDAPSTIAISRLDRLLRDIRDMNANAYALSNSLMLEDLADFSEYEAEYQYKSLIRAVPIEWNFATVTPESVYAAAMSRPFQGRLLKEWQAGLEAQRMTRIRDAVRIGFIEGQTVQQIINRIRGTRARGYSDGLIEIDRRNAEAVVRTAIGHVAGMVRDRFYEANNDIIKGCIWVSTLDLRTSAPCRIRDHLKYDLEHKPIGHEVPWGAGPGRLHFNCRSTSSPLVASWQELGVDLTENEKVTRASMSGQVPDGVLYLDWIKAQSPEAQDEVLGETRAKMLRDGTIDAKDLYDSKGKFLTLDALREKLK